MHQSESLPLVSVFMPTYNQETLVAEAIESVLAQDYDNWELVIGDDCSTDSTYQIIKQYQQRFPQKIKPYTNSKNLGITKNFNKLLNHCSGKYIAFFAGDDLYLPKKLSSQTMLMESIPNCIITYHDIEVFDSASSQTIRFWNSGKNSAQPVTGEAALVAKELVVQGTKFMAALSVMVRRDVIPEQGHDERVPIASDWLLWVEICAQNSGEVAFLDGVYAKYRKHSNNITNKSNEYKEDLFVTLAIIESRYRFLTKDAQRRRAKLYYRRAIEELKVNNFSLARSLLREHLRHSFLSWKIIRCWAASFYKQFKHHCLDQK